MSDSGEITVTANVGGRRLTLDPIRLLHLDLPLREVESTIPAGLQVQWASGDVEGKPVELNVGAGFGSRWATIAYDGKHYAFRVDDLLLAFLAAIGVGPDAKGDTDAR